MNSGRPKKDTPSIIVPLRLDIILADKLRMASMLEGMPFSTYLKHLILTNPEVKNESYKKAKVHICTP